MALEPCKCTAWSARKGAAVSSTDSTVLASPCSAVAALELLLRNVLRKLPNAVRMTSDLAEHAGSPIDLRLGQGTTVAQAVGFLLQEAGRNGPVGINDLFQTVEKRYAAVVKELAEVRERASCGFLRVTHYVSDKLQHLRCGRGGQWNRLENRTQGRQSPAIVLYAGPDKEDIGRYLERVRAWLVRPVLCDLARANDGFEPGDYAGRLAHVLQDNAGRADLSSAHELEVLFGAFRHATPLVLQDFLDADALDDRTRRNQLVQYYNHAARAAAVHSSKASHHAAVFVQGIEWRRWWGSRRVQKLVSLLEEQLEGSRVDVFYEPLDTVRRRDGVELLEDCGRGDETNKFKRELAFWRRPFPSSRDVYDKVAEGLGEYGLLPFRR